MPNNHHDHPVLGCPFCGAEPEHKEFSFEGPGPRLDISHRLSCEACGIYKTAPSYLDLVKLWNTRTTARLPSPDNNNPRDLFIKVFLALRDAPGGQALGVSPGEYTNAEITKAVLGFIKNPPSPSLTEETK